MTTPAGYLSLYAPTGRVAHLVWEPDWANQAAYPHAACGWWAGHTYWRGTGSQDEYERAADLPRCRKCLRAVTA